MDRRRFLELAAGFVALGLTGLACRLGSSSRQRGLAHPALLDIFDDPGVVAQIGASYRRAHPDEADEETLERLLLSSRGEDSPLPAEQGQWLENRVREDFAAGRTIIVGGWVLAITEARQCALFSLRNT